MDTLGTISGVGYCGLVCAVCSRSDEGCLGCRAGGGNVHCVQRQCCRNKRLDGCWQCESFPCDKGYLAGEEWRGLCIACVQSIKAHGVEALVSRSRLQLGEMVDYGDYRFKDTREISETLRGHR